MYGAIYTSGIYRYMNTQMYSGVHKPESSSRNSCLSETNTNVKLNYLLLNILYNVFFYQCSKLKKIEEMNKNCITEIQKRFLSVCCVPCHALVLDNIVQKGSTGFFCRTTISECSLRACRRCTITLAVWIFTDMYCVSGLVTTEEKP